MTSPNEQPWHPLPTADDLPVEVETQYPEHKIYKILTPPDLMKVVQWGITGWRSLRTPLPSQANADSPPKGTAPSTAAEPKAGVESATISQPPGFKYWHNPDNLTPEQFGWPKWRGLKVGEVIREGDEWWELHKEKWLPSGCLNFNVNHKAHAYRTPNTPEVPEPKTKSLMQDTIDKLTQKIHQDREEISRAFIAKYQCQPDEIEQIHETTETGTKWYLRKKPAPSPKPELTDEELGAITSDILLPSERWKDLMLSQRLTCIRVALAVKDAVLADWQKHYVDRTKELVCLAETNGIEIANLRSRLDSANLEVNRLSAKFNDIKGALQKVLRGLV